MKKQTANQKIESLIEELGLNGKDAARMMNMKYQTFRNKKAQAKLASGNTSLFSEDNYHMLLRNLWLKINALCIKEGIKKLD